MDNLFLDCKEDGLLISEVKEQSNEKLFYLKRYLEMFLISTNKYPWRSINYLDFFAGAGKSKINKKNEIIIGSPLISLNLPHPFDNYYFIESKKNKFRALKQRCEKSPLSNKIHLYWGDCNGYVASIVNEISKFDKQFIQGKYPSLNFAFLDPFGLDLKWSSIVELSKIEKMDLLIYYPQMGLERQIPNLYQSPLNNNIDDFFGCDTWRYIYSDYKTGKLNQLHRSLMDLYWRNLVSLHYLENSQTEPLMVSETTKAPLYRLMLASKNDLAIKLWKAAITKDDNGQMKLCL